MTDPRPSKREHAIDVACTALIVVAVLMVLTPFFFIRQIPTSISRYLPGDLYPIGLVLWVVSGMIGGLATTRRQKYVAITVAAALTYFLLFVLSV